MRRNLVCGPGFVNLDFSVIGTSSSETDSAWKRGEFFNMRNHPSFADPDHDLSDSPTLERAQFTPDIAGSKSCDRLLGAKMIWRLSVDSKAALKSSLFSRVVIST
jgi:hypothetical protein